ncbi:Argonaute complex, subunit Arb1 [Hypoxylon sp. FL1284]|nr:Argonaute complex, subunit Arb1 [Hypoxylon sp. FL1284]
MAKDIEATGGLADDASRDEETAVESDGGIAASGDLNGKAVDEATQVQVEPQVKKKNKKNKKKGGAARKKVTGFEEYYAEPPMTPADAAEEKTQIYNPTRPFADRIEECVQRYRARRRMDSERTLLFNKYMWLGGIDTGPRQFTGFAGDRAALEGADADEIRQMTATDFVGGSGKRFYDPMDPEREHWIVDFEGIVKGFLSRTIPGLYMYDEPAIRKAAELVKNFLNYVLFHDVCPEYTTDVMAARNICDTAPVKLRTVHELHSELPGNFSRSASQLFYDREVDRIDENENVNFDKLLMFRLTVIFSALVSDEVKKQFVKEEDPTNISVVDTKEETYEVVDVTRPHHKHVEAVEEQLKKNGYGGKAKPAGILKLKKSIIDFGYDNIPRPDEVDMSNAKVEEYLLEDELLSKLEKGMKIRAVVCKLSIGLRFIKEIKDVRVSFDLFLPQMLMEYWKDPVPNTRPAPSATNPNAEEDAAGADD